MWEEFPKENCEHLGEGVADLQLSQVKVAMQ